MLEKNKTNPFAISYIYFIARYYLYFEWCIQDVSGHYLFQGLEWLSKFLLQPWSSSATPLHLQLVPKACWFCLFDNNLVNSDAILGLLLPAARIAVQPLN